MSQTSDNLLPGPRVDQRYGISAMTRWRWERNAALAFPKPLRINGRCYWRVDELAAWERGRAEASPAA
jgi:predicted DNA-binding transcriptional regulator AlpA